MDIKVYVFRIAYDNKCVLEELKNGRLRQGWGDSTASLDLSEDEWVKNHLKLETYDLKAEEKEKKRLKKKYNELKIMTEFKENDIIIIPKTPDSNCFTMCRAAGKLTFQKPNCDIDDFYHLIPIKDKHEYKYHANEDTEIIHAKMRAYQSPVNNVWNYSFVEAAKRLMGSEGKPFEIPIEETIKNIKEDVLNNKIPELLKRVRALGHEMIEKITRRIFERLGYIFVSSNSYDKRGGDADLIFENDSLSKLFDEAVNSEEVSGQIFIQVKNKNGVDQDDTKGAKQLVIRTESEPNPTSILISTADEFTPECKNYASQNNILLIDGKGFINLIIKYLD